MVSAARLSDRSSRLESELPTPLPAAQQSAWPKIAFVFNHEAHHQIAHAAPVLNALAEQAAPLELYAVTTSSQAIGLVRSFLSPHAKNAVTIHQLELPAPFQQLARLADKIVPMSRLATLARHRNFLAQFDALVSPEATILHLRNKLGVTRPKYIYTNHGAGDRSISVHPALGQFDLLLLSGPKLRDRLVQMKIATLEQCALIGYAKFDACAKTIAQPPSFFSNGRPTVLYNPHFDPKLSSWYKMGRGVLDFFAESAEYNLVFAPHVMLFQKRLHASVEHWHIRWRSDLADSYRTKSNILVETGSIRSTDMSYTMSADIYLGDASSQLYEFLVKPRPCLFLNSHRAKWRGNADYMHWNAGPVLSDLSTFGSDLQQAIATHPETYLARQQKMFTQTFDLTHTPSTVRAAVAIRDYLDRNIGTLATTAKPEPNDPRVA